LLQAFGALQQGCTATATHATLVTNKKLFCFFNSNQWVQLSEAGVLARLVELWVRAWLLWL
jgi:hypothetical protein